MESKKSINVIILFANCFLMSMCGETSSKKCDEPNSIKKIVINEQTLIKEYKQCVLFKVTTFSEDQVKLTEFYPQNKCLIIFSDKQADTIVLSN